MTVISEKVGFVGINYTTISKKKSPILPILRFSMGVSFIALRLNACNLSAHA